MENNTKNISINNINFRQASLQDIDQILDFDSLNNIPLFTRLKLENEISNNSNYCSVAYYENEVIGYASMSVLYDHADILYVSTNNNFKRIGIATSLINILINKCKELKLESIFIEVRESNIPAINLYIKCGFSKISERENYYSLPTENAIILKRII